MDDAHASDPDVIDLAVQLCTRVGMMMEDVSPVALNASHQGLEERVAVIAGAARTMATISAAAQALLER